MKIKLFLSISLLLFGVVGCTKPEYRTQKSAFIVMKTPSWRYADMGFIYENEKELKVEIYSLGKALMSLEINGENICLSRFECMDKKSFNTKVLSTYYPDTLLEDIFHGKTIFEKQGWAAARNGFTQNIFQQGQYDIKYTVFNQRIYFRDKMNGILIKIKKQQR